MSGLTSLYGRFLSGLVDYMSGFCHIMSRYVSGLSRVCRENVGVEVQRRPIILISVRIGH